MLSSEDIQAIREEMHHFPAKRAAAGEALKIVQRRHGWVSDEHLKEVAALLEMSPAELDGFATFYTLIYRKPVGRHVILICESISCHVMGYPKMLAHLRARLGVDLGQTTADGRFTLLPVPCLGACDHAPAMMVDQDMHLDLDEQKIDQVLAKYV